MVPHRPRRRPAHGVLLPGGDDPIIVFVTVCTAHRQDWLASHANHALLRQVWAQASAWIVGRYVVMPDHVHLFAAPGDGEHTLERWMAFWKSLFTRAHGDARQRWQRGHWDTRLRRVDSYAEKWEYIRMNPVRHGHAQRPEDWPYQGEVNVLPW